MILNARIDMAPPRTQKAFVHRDERLLSWYHPTSPAARAAGLFESAAPVLEDSSPITGAIRLGLLRTSRFSLSLRGRVGVEASVRPAAPRPFSAVPWTLLLSCRRFSGVPAFAYSPSSTPLRMNLLARTITASVPGVKRPLRFFGRAAGSRSPGPPRECQLRS